MKKTYALGLSLLVLGLVIALSLQPKTPDGEKTISKEAPLAATEVIPVVKKTEAVEKPTREPLANLDLRVDGKVAKALSAERQMALEAFEKKQTGVSVSFDPVTSSPRWIGSTTGLLSTAQPEVAAADADAPIRSFINAQRTLFGHGAEVLDKARRVTDYSTARGPSRKVVWHQQLDGLDLFEAILQANLTKDSALINISSQMMPTPEHAMEASRRADLIANTPVTVEQAVAAAGSNVGENIQADAVRPMAAPAAQADRRQSFRATMLTDAEAKLTWVPMNESELRLAWDVTLTSRSRAEMYRVLVDAETQQVLVRQALTAYISPASYRVYTKESPTPFSPGHETPSSLQPPLIPRELITLDALDTTASPNGWINDGDNITSGNNTDTYTDTDNTDTPDLPRTTGSPSRVFDFPMDLNQAPSTYKDASNTQLFYWTNFMHDRLYQLGFTEAAGNFQVNNFGRGGVANDPVNAEAQDGSGVNNANFSTPPDGGRGRMQMYVWTSPNPDRDGSFEAEVVLHEYAHGLSNRLVGGPSVSISNLSSRGMGEGWSDFYGLALTAEAADNPHGNWARAGYSRYLSSNWLSENYYYGARRYSYSTDMQKNPHTLRDIDPTQVDWHNSVPRNPTYAATQDATQVHYQGTVWCVTLWDLRANLIMKHGFNVGNERALFLVTEGMKLGPANPNFIEARDGIIQATLVNHASDLGEVWAAFAKRGMGHGATAPVSTTTTGIVESYSVPDHLEISDRSGWNIRGDQGGAFLPTSKTITLSNDGSSVLNWTSNPGVPWLSISPASGSLAAGANVTVTITTQPAGVASGFHSTNIVFTNTTSTVSQPIGVRLYVTPPVAQSFDLSSNPGWMTSGEWAFGTPTGAGGTGSGGSGNADPSAGATGSNVFGVNLSGNASSSTGGPFYLTTTSMNLSQRKNTRLRFKRWLNANALANARMTVEVSSDGVSWREVFVNPGTAITDSSWQIMEYDISSLADRQATVLVRWGYQNISTAGSYAGWNIDDVELLGDSIAQFQLAFADSIVESGAAITGTVTLNLPQAEDVTVSLNSSVTSAATVPASIIIPANSTSQTFAITPVDDGLLDGTQITKITATAPSITTAERNLSVHDNETTTLTLNLPASVAEGATALSGSISVGTAPDSPVSVALSSSATGLSLPATVTLPAGSTAPVSFTFSAPDNAFAEGTKNLQVTASVSGWTQSQANIQITDDETPQILITSPASGREGDGTLNFTATVNTLHATPVTISLMTADSTELEPPLSVQIPVGQLSADFTVTLLNDTLQDGPQSVVITGSSAGYQSGTRTVTVLDNDVASYAFATISSPQKRNSPFAVSVSARDISGATITNHSGSVMLTSSSAAGAVPFSPATMTVFSQGVATANVTVSSTATAMSFTASDGTSSGTSNVFDVEAVQHQGFTFVTPASTSSNTLFSTTVTAVDDEGTRHTEYNEATEIDILAPYFDRTVGSSSSPINTSKIYNTSAHDSRVQLIYTAAELGAAPKLLGTLFTYPVTTSGQNLTNFKVRLKHTTLENFDGQSWEETGWKEVYSSSSYATTNSFWGTFTQPFAYDGVRNLMIDISFDNASTSTPGTLRHMTASSNRMLSGTSNSTHGNPLTWSAATGPAPVISNELPVIAFYEARSLGKIPQSPVTFTSGIWTGQTFVPPVSVWLRATASSGVWGVSNLILSGGSVVNTSTSVVFSDGFETGTLGASWSTSGNSGVTARTLVTANNTPKTGTYHLTMDTTSAATGTFAANRPTLTLNLVGRKNVSLEWFAKGFADESSTPTLTGPFGTFDSSMNYDGVAISPDGITWVEIRSLRSLSSTYGTSVTRIMLDPIVQRLGWSYTSNFRMRFSQYDDQSIPNDGIAIDDVAVRANPVSSIGVLIPSNIIEGALDIPVTVTLPLASGSDTYVTLVSNSPARLAINSPVLIPAGQTSANTTASAPQNQFADLGIGTVITASASGQTTSYHNVRVEDDEQAVLTVTLPASVTEGGTFGIGTVTIEPVQLFPTNVFLGSSNLGEATVTNMVTIASGARSAPFSVSPVNDVRMDGTQQVSITASGQGLTTSSSTMDVLDNENTVLAVTAPGPLTEGGSPGVGTVSISGTRLVDTTVMLTSSDETEATVTASVLIPAGQTSGNFQAFPVDDALQDGPQTVTITASSESLQEGTATFTVADNDPAYFEWAIVPSPQTRNVPFSVTLTARDGTDNVLAGFNGTVNLSAQGSSGLLPVTPAVSGTFVNGVWTGSLSLGAVSNSVTLRATGNDGAAGVSEAFDVVAGGPAVALAFSAISSPQQAGACIPVRVFAVDANGVLVNEVTGAVTLQLLTAPGGASVSTAELTLVNGSASTAFVVPASHAGMRFQATAGALTGLSAIFAVSDPSLIAYPQPEVIFVEDFETGSLQPAWVISGTGLHRTQVTTANGPRGSYHLTMDSTTNLNFARNEATLTLNLEGKSDVELSFWMKESSDEDHSPAANPFTGGADFDGVAISADGVTWYEVKGLRTPDGIGSLYQQFKINLSTAAAGFGLSLNSAFKIRFNHYDDYTYGSDGFAFDDIVVRANAFLPPEPVVTLFTDDFETGIFKPQWQITGTNLHRTRITTEQAPRGQFHLMMDVHQTADSRNEATLTLDTSGHQDVVLKFWMKENSDEDQAPPTNPFFNGADFDGVAISTNGTTWYEVQALRSTLSTNTYQEFTVDLDAMMQLYGLAHGPGVKIRFNHFDNSSWVNGDGFAFDDVSVTARPVQQLMITAPDSVMEGTSIQAQVSIPSLRSVDTLVSLNSNRPGSVTLPGTITIPAGSLISVPFTLSAAQDALLTGDQAFQIAATAEGYRRSSAEVWMTDDELPGGFDLSLVGPLNEGSSINGSVSVSAATLFDLDVPLKAEPAQGLNLPVHVVIPAGGSSASFSLGKPNNTMILEPASTVITAKLAAASDTAVVTLTDNDAITPLTLSVPASLLENAGPQNASISLTSPATAGVEIVVTLTSSLPGQLSVPATVTIPIGSSSAFFEITPVNDSLTDGTASVTLSASANGLTGDSEAVSVLDDDVHHFAMVTPAFQQIIGQTITTTITAQDVNNQTITSYNGTPAMQVINAADAVVSQNAAFVSSFTSGVANATVVVLEKVPAARLRVSDPVAGVSSTSGVFAVDTGAHTRFIWSSVANPVSVGVPFSATLTAKDDFGNTITDFTSPADLSLISENTIGTSGSAWTTPLNTTSHDVRSQILYTAAEVTRTGPISSLSLNFTAVPGADLKNFTIRLKQVAKTAYTSAAVDSWEQTGWTTCYQTTQRITQTGWTRFLFTTPFNYDGLSSLMVDISFGNDAAAATSGSLLASTAIGSPLRTITGFSNSTHGNPLDWSGTVPTLNLNSLRPHVQLGFPSGNTVTPAATTAFTAGIWTGPVTVGTIGTGMYLVARSGSAAGMTSVFNAALPPLEATLTFQDSALESAGVISGTLSLNRTSSSSYTVLLSSSSSSISIASSVTLPANTLSIPINAIVSDDALNNGGRDVTLTANVLGLNSTSRQVRVIDDELHRFTVSDVAASQVKGVPFAVTITAVSINGEAIPNYTGSATLSGVTPPGSGMVITQQTLSNFSSGVVRTVLTAGKSVSSMYLAIAGSGKVGAGNSFSVLEAGAGTRLAWSSLPNLILSSTPQLAGFVLRDAAGNLASAFSGQVSFSVESVRQRLNDTGVVSAFPLETEKRLMRSQQIVTAAELGGSGEISSLSLLIKQAGPEATLDQFTVRLKHSSAASFEGESRWDNDGLTTVYQTDQVVKGTGSLVFSFDTPFAYNGTDHLLVELSYRDSSAAGFAGPRFATSPLVTGSGSFRYQAVETAAEANPLAWNDTNSNPVLLDQHPLLEIGFGSDITVSPSSVTLGSIVWNGQLTFTGAGQQLRLRATSPALPGSSFSSVFDLINPPLFDPEPAFAGGLENTLTWASASPVPEVQYELQRSLKDSFSPSVTTLTASTSSVQTGLENGVTYYYRYRARGAGWNGPWSPVVSSTQDNVLPAFSASEAVTTGSVGVISGTITDAAGIGRLHHEGTDISVDAKGRWYHRFADLSYGLNTFTLSFADAAVPANTSTAQVSIVRLMDDTYTAPTFHRAPESRWAVIGQEVRFSPVVLGTRPLLYAWKKNDATLTTVTGPELVLPAVKTTDAARYQFRATSTKTGENTQSDFALLLHTALPERLTAKVGSAIKISTTTTVPKGVPAPTFQWSRPGLSNPSLTDGLQSSGARIAGSQSHTLNVSGLSLAETGLWRLRITSGTTFTERDVQVQVLNLAPQIVSWPQVVEVYVSEFIDIIPSAMNSPTSFSAKGLPSGLTLDSRTGRITGRLPTATKIDAKTGVRIPIKISLSAKNAVGSSSPVQILIFVNDHFIPLAGTYQGLVDRDPKTNFDMGGSLSMTVAKTGIASGSFSLAGQRYSFKQPLTPLLASGSGAGVYSAEMTFTLPRSKPAGLLPLTVRLRLSTTGGDGYMDDLSVPTITLANIYGTGTAGAANDNVSGVSSAQFSGPQGIAQNHDGQLYVADSGNHLIRRLTPSRHLPYDTQTEAGTTGVAGGLDGVNATFSTPAALVVGPGNVIYVADTGNATIRRISAGEVTTLAGAAGQRATTDGTGSSARFDTPAGICTDPAGNVYVTDRESHVIRKITATGVVTTLAGKAYAFGNINGSGGKARFQNPEGIVYDPVQKALFVLDAGRQIRRVTLTGAVTTWLTDLPAAQAITTDGRGHFFVAAGASTLSPEGEVWHVSPTKIRRPLSITSLDMRGLVYVRQTDSLIVCHRDQHEIHEYALLYPDAPRGDAYLIFSRTPPAPADVPVGLYNVALADELGSNSHLHISNKATSSNVTGRLSDGTAFTLSSALGVDRQLYIHQMLAGNQGSFQGSLIFDPASVSAGSGFSWLKNDPASRSQPQKLKSFFSVTGSRYTPGNLHTYLDLSASPAALRIKTGFEGEPWLLSQPLTLAAPNTFQLPASNPQQVKLSVNASTGLVTGSFLMSNPTRTATFSGLFIREVQRAVGHALIPDTAAKNSPLSSKPMVIEIDTE